jgi:hypothetical protein
MVIPKHIGAMVSWVRIKSIGFDAHRSFNFAFAEARKTTIRLDIGVF